LLVVLLALFARSGLWPAWHSLDTDFPNYYLAASLYRQGIPLDRAYEATWFQRQKDHLGIQQPFVGFAPYPPISIVPVLPLTGLQPLTAKRVWLTLNLGFLSLILWILHCVTRLSWRRIALISFLCIFPLRANFLLGQYYLLVLLLICGAYYASRLTHRFTSGVLLAAAAALKLFPALFLILFLWKRDWRSAAGLTIGVAALAAVSVIAFGSEVHRVYLIEVLPRALRGDLFGSYFLEWNSFTALWHRLFLFEPELNPSPLVNSPLIYAFAQTITGTALLFGLLLSTRDDSVKFTKALEWAAFVLLLLLLSPVPAPYHYCVLIFTASIGVDALQTTTNKRHALTFLLLFAIACAPVPGNFGKPFVLTRLLTASALYVFMLRTLSRGRRLYVGRKRLAAAALVSAVLLVFNSLALLGRAGDFSSRIWSLPTEYRGINPVALAGRIGFAFSGMRLGGYEAMVLENRTARPIPLSGDVLSIAGFANSSVVYAELASRRSSIVRLTIGPVSSVAEFVADGEQPAVSSDGKWLAFIREDHGTRTVWMSQADSAADPQPILESTYNALDISVTLEGNLVASVGGVGAPRLALLRREKGIVEPLSGINGPARYPSISADGKRLAFSRREWGSWHLVVRDLASGMEQQLTHGACNAVSPSWEDGQTLLYATDCARGLGRTALARITVQN
jgi:hypothetical protein